MPNTIDGIVVNGQNIDTIVMPNGEEIHIGGVDISDTTLTADLAAFGYYFYLADGTKVQGTLIDGDDLGYGYTDEGLPLAGVAQAGYASAADPTLPAMSLGTGVVGTDRVV